MNRKFISYFLFCAISFGASAETVTLDQAIEKALNNDNRILEKQAFVSHARAMLEEAEGSTDISLSANAFVGISAGVDGGFFENDNCGNGTECEVRDDRYTLEDGLSPWFNVQFGIIKPLNTFGKVESYAAAAKENIKLKQQDVRLQRGEIIYDVKRAYYGFLTAQDTHAFLKDIKSKIDSALELVQSWLGEGEGNATQSDLYALQSASALADSYILKVTALEGIAIDGLKVLTGLGLNQELTLGDSRLSPVELPGGELAALQSQALTDRPEMQQLKHGLEARRSLVKANKSMKKPNLYAGLVGMMSYSPLRDRVDNPHIYDPFNDIGTTPVLGIQWEWAGSVQNAKVKQAQAELNALVEKGAFAQKGIPYQVSEAYSQVHAQYAALQSLKKSAKAARRWMIASYADFEAGIEPVDKVVSAFQAYVLAYTDYLKTVYDYNMQIAQLEQVTGAYQ